MQWFSQTFSQLDTQTLYAILQLRAEVFVVEQTCYYQDLDGLDCLNDTIHLYAKQDGKIIAYARCMAPGVSYPQDSAIGRVVTSEQARGNGLGHTLIKKAVEVCEAYWPNHTIHMSAQEHLQNYYAQHGFVSVGEGYLEDDIPHIGMIRQVQSA